jgi:hypothetical protein
MSRRFRWKRLEANLMQAALLDVTVETAFKLSVLKMVGLNRAIYTWSGRYFGQRVKDWLLTLDGVQAGYFYGDEIFGADGFYLGEVREGRLVTHQGKKSKRWLTFSPQRGKGFEDRRQKRERPMSTGFEDFPSPRTFKANDEARGYS